jgi:hypothetical protein
MSWTAQVIEAHERDLSRRPGDRRGKLIEIWKHCRSRNSAEPTINLALQLVADGTANEVELGFYVLMDLGLADASLLSHLGRLAKHRSAAVRRALAFHLSGELPPEFCAEVYRELLRDKAASVRARTIESVGMRAFQSVLADLRVLRSVEQNPKVIKALDFWIPLLSTGYRVDQSSHPGRLEVTALTGRGTATRTLETTDPCDPRIPKLVAELRSMPF